MLILSLGAHSISKHKDWANNVLVVYPDLLLFLLSSGDLMINWSILPVVIIFNILCFFFHLVCNVNISSVTEIHFCITNLKSTNVEICKLCSRLWSLRDATRLVERWYITSYWYIGSNWFLQERTWTCSTRILHSRGWCEKYRDVCALLLGPWIMQNRVGNLLMSL